MLRGVPGISPGFKDAFVAHDVDRGVVLRVGWLLLLRACVRGVVDPCPVFARLKWGGWGLGAYPLAGWAGGPLPLHLRPLDVHYFPSLMHVGVLRPKAPSHVQR